MRVLLLLCVCVCVCLCLCVCVCVCVCVQCVVSISDCSFVGRDMEKDEVVVGGGKSRRELELKGGRGPVQY